MDTKKGVKSHFFSTKTTKNNRQRHFFAKSERTVRFWVTKLTGLLVLILNSTEIDFEQNRLYGFHQVVFPVTFTTVCSVNVSVVVSVVVLVQFCGWFVVVSVVVCDRFENSRREIRRFENDRDQPQNNQRDIHRKTTKTTEQPQNNHRTTITEQSQRHPQKTREQP